jgi:CBS domain-containing protein
VFAIVNNHQVTTIRMALNPSVRVRAAMSKHIISADAARSVRSAIKTMIRNDVGSLIITHDSQPVGIVTERDIMKSIGYGRVKLDTEVGEITTKPLISIGSDATLGEAADIMIKRKIRRLMIKENTKYVGIVTQRDLQRLMTDTFKSLILM